MKSQGFTVVELAVVVVVIGILAAMVTVGYQGVKARGYDVAVMSDLDNFVTAYTNANVGYETIHDDGNYTRDKLASLNWQATQDAYDTTVYGNLLFCHNLSPHPLNPDWGTPPEDRTNWALVALSKSGATFYVMDSMITPKKYTGTTNLNYGLGGNVCGVVIDELGAEGFANVYGGYRIDDTVTGPWRAWAGDND